MNIDTPLTREQVPADDAATAPRRESTCAARPRAARALAERWDDYCDVLDDDY